MNDADGERERDGDLVRADFDRVTLESNEMVFDGDLLRLDTLKDRENDT